MENNNEQPFVDVLWFRKKKMSSVSYYFDVSNKSLIENSID